MPLIGRFLGAGILSLAQANAARTALGIAAKSDIGYEPESETPQAPIHIPVSSSAIRSIGYIPEDTIIVEFNRGGTYSYDGPFELFSAFVTAPSKGQFFNNHFKK